MSRHNSPVTVPVLNRLFVTSEFIMQKSQYMGNLSFFISSIFIQLSNKLLRRGKKIFIYSVLVKFYFLNLVLFVNFCNSHVCLNHISLLLLCKTTLAFAAFKLSCQDLGLLARSVELETEDAT